MGWGGVGRSVGWVGQLVGWLIVIFIYPKYCTITNQFSLPMVVYFHQRFMISESGINGFESELNGHNNQRVCAVGIKAQACMCRWNKGTVVCVQVE